MGSGLSRAGDMATSLGKRMSILSAGVAAVAGATLLLVRNAASMGDAIGDASKAAGMSTTAFQEYRYALKEAADMSDDEFASAAAKLNKTLGEAREGSAAAVKAFEAIGVSQAQLADESFTADQAMAAFVTRMEALKDPAIAAAVSTDLFGKAGASLGAALSGTPGQVGELVDRARALGVVLGPEAVAAAGKFDEKMNELGARFEAFKFQIADVLLPVIMDDLIPAFEKHVIPAIQAVIASIGDWIKWFGDLDPAIQSVVGWVTAAFAVGGPVLLAIGAVATGISALIAATGPVGLFIAAAGLLYTAWQTWGDDIKAAIGPAIDWIGDKVEWLMKVFDAFLGKIKSMAQSVTEFFSVSQEEINAMDFGGASGLGFEAGSTGGMGDFPGGGVEGAVGGAMGGQMLGAGIVNGAFMGAMNAMNEKREAFAALFAQIPQIARDTLGIHSPSTVFAEIGGYLGEGMAQGIEASNGIVAAAVGAMGAGAVTAANGMTNDILAGLNTLLAGSQKAGARLAMVNTLIGASQEIKNGTFGFASMARVLAQGAALVKGIQGARSGAVGGSAVGSTGASSAAAAAPAQQNVQTLNFTLQNDSLGIGQNLVRQIAAQLNEAQRNGSTLIRATVS
jgi:hypothetical protein